MSISFSAYSHAGTRRKPHSIACSSMKASIRAIASREDRATSRALASPHPCHQDDASYDHEGQLEQGESP